MLFGKARYRGRWISNLSGSMHVKCVPVTIRCLDLPAAIFRLNNFSMSFQMPTLNTCHWGTVFSKKNLRKKKYRYKQWRRARVWNSSGFWSTSNSQTWIHVRFRINNTQGKTFVSLHAFFFSINYVPTRRDCNEIIEYVFIYFRRL